MRYLLLLGILLLAAVPMSKADLAPGEKVPNPLLTAPDSSQTQLHSLLKKVTVLHLWKCNWLQCRAEIPHIQELIKQFPNHPISWISVNTINPKEQADAEIKRYNIDFPVFYGRGQDINKNFKVNKLPRLILIKADSTVDQDVLFLKADELKMELERMLKEAGVDSIQTSPLIKKE